MFKFALVLAFVAVASAADVVPIVSSDSEVSHDGKFHYSFETGDGTSVQQSGELKQVGQESGESVQGHFSYQSPEGEKVEVSYQADENGYQPSGSVLPQPHPIPELIQRALEYNAQHPEQNEEKHH